ncbi:MAG: two-component system, OmpR family, response regulator MprA, partial [Solirubrobacteraceae bacterium]|nr:two-component system, OmpR family, response regulator MprA [Solirubrobacteraceae bacterium]
ELAAVHGASVSVASAPGAGSTFTVRVPFGTAHLPQDQVGHEDVDDVAEVQRYGAGYLAEATRWFDAATREQDETSVDARPRTSRPRLLVVDDNADMRDYVSGLLQDEYRIETARDGIEALDAARTRPPDLVLTDVMMPRLDGFGLLTALREDAATMHVPVIMLSARSGDEATVAGLEAGADDYLAKPFALEELLARLRALLRRSGWDGDRQVLRFGDLELDPHAYEVFRGERRIELTRTEFLLLELFLHHPRQVLTREVIFDRVWSYDFGPASNSLEVYVGYLRRKTEAAGEPRLLHTIRGVGYVLKDMAIR